MIIKNNKTFAINGPILRINIYENNINENIILDKM
jgi:hypothetical protein